mmetsp:Transcript_55561/g.166542  ORF Transcript_55561/g.166542 Transcript_55561/m.166542 type:complete len:590 (-) Transcript_55561:841-2610(-)
MSPSQGDVAAGASEHGAPTHDEENVDQSDRNLRLREGVEAGLCGEGGHSVKGEGKTSLEPVNRPRPAPRANRWWRLRPEGNNDKSDAEDTEGSTPAESMDEQDSDDSEDTAAAEEEKTCMNNDDRVEGTDECSEEISRAGTKESAQEETEESAPVDSTEEQEQEEASVPMEQKEGRSRDGFACDKETKHVPASVEASVEQNLVEQKGDVDIHLGGAQEGVSLTTEQQDTSQSNTAEQPADRSSSVEQPSKDVDGEGCGEMSKEEQDGSIVEGDAESTGIVLRSWDTDRGYTPPSNGRRISNWLASRRNRRTHRQSDNDGGKGGEREKQDRPPESDDQNKDVIADLEQVFEELDAKASLRQRRRARRAAVWRALTLRENRGRTSNSSPDDEEEKEEDERSVSIDIALMERRIRQRLQIWLQKARLGLVTASHVAKRASVGVAGACLVTIGIPLLIFPIPGPGIGMICGGLYVLSTEFDCTQDMLDAARLKCSDVFRRIGLRTLMLEGNSAQPDSLVLVGQPLVSHVPKPMPLLLPAPESQEPRLDVVEELGMPEEEAEDSEIDSEKSITKVEEEVEDAARCSGDARLQTL